MKKKKNKKSVNIDKVFVTYRNDYVNFEFSKTRTSKSKKAKTQVFVDGVVWKKKTRIDKTIGDMMLTNKDTSTITILIQPLHLFVEITRGSNFFGVKISLMSSRWDTRGLCKWVPSNEEELLTREYEKFSSITPIPGYSGTTVRFTSCSISILFLFFALLFELL